MKTLKYLFLAIMAMVATTTFTACSDDDNATDNDNDNSTVSDQTDAEIISVDSISLYEYWSDVLARAQEGNDEEDSLEAATAKQALAAMDSLWNDYVEKQGGNSDGTYNEEGKYSSWCIQVYTIRYNSIDQYGNPITLSELMVIPYNSFWGDVKPNDYVIYCHPCLNRNYERPSNFYYLKENNDLTKDLEEAVRAVSSSWNYRHNIEGVAIIPDYQGFGESSNRYSPCMNIDLLARQTVDGFAAAKSVMTTQKLRTMESDWTTTIWGFGTGASVAAATQRYMENNKQSGSSTTLAADYRLRGSVLYDGIYDLEAIMKSYATGGKIFDPIQLARIICGLCDADPNLRGEYTAKDFLSEKFVNAGILDFVYDQRTHVNLGSYIFKLMRSSWNGDINVYIPYYIKTKLFGGEEKSAWAACNKTWHEQTKNAGYYKFSYQKLALKDNLSFSGGSDDHSLNSYPDNNDNFFYNYFFGDSNGNNPKNLYMEASDVLCPALIKYYNGESLWYSEKKKCEAMSKALAANSLCKDWTPKYPLIVAYSTNDRSAQPSVNIENFKTAMSNSSDKIRYYYTPELIIRSTIFYNRDVLETMRKNNWSKLKTSTKLSLVNYKKGAVVLN